MGTTEGRVSMFLASSHGIARIKSLNDVLDIAPSQFGNYRTIVFNFNTLCNSYMPSTTTNISKKTTLRHGFTPCKTIRVFSRVLNFLRLLISVPVYFPSGLLRLNSLSAFSPRIFRRAFSSKKGRSKIALGRSKSQCGQSEAYMS